MEVVAGIDALGPSNGRLFVVVGVFDGLHRGHHYLLRHLRTEAARRSARPAVVTFDHHPDEILQGAAPPLLCDPVERLELLARSGVAVTIVQHFDVTLRMTPYDAFVGRIAERVELAGFLMTPDAAFGHERAGTVEAVSELGRRLGYDVAVVEPLSVDGRPVRSAEIRSDIAAGDLAGASRLLGRDVSVTGATSRRGDVTELRFELPVALPPPGDYEARATPDGAGSERRRALRIDHDAVVLVPALDVPDGMRVRVRLPVQAPTATIRRSQ
jgi:riboflavin kinase/FMN adenylyltransferase